ncbi:hypothetical protein C8R44DRAFT_891469 [Mycena epipterygia]|nr:hypothetical protein C8R44DRAFT_891469 [Mycena epipterygia]
MVSINQMVLVSALLGVLKEWTPSYGHRGGYVHLEDAGAQVLGVSHSEFYEPYQDHLLRSIEIAFMSPITPFVVIRDLSEFREHVEQPLPIYHSTLGEYSMKFLATEEWHERQEALVVHEEEAEAEAASTHALDEPRGPVWVMRGRKMVSELEEVIMYQRYADQPERQQMKRKSGSVRTLIINPEDGAYGVHQICEPVSQVAPHESGGEDDQFAAYSTQALTLVRVHTTTTRKPRRTWSTLRSWGRKAQPRRTPTVDVNAPTMSKSAGGDPRSAQDQRVRD